MTANLAWPEITSALMYRQKVPDRPDLVVWVFQAKLQSLLKDIARGVLGEVSAYLYTIEFQKCGLPHAHIIVFLKPHAKLHTPEDIDSLMSSKFPTANDELLQLIKKFMVHTPCGNQNPSAPCMVNGICFKSFPKPFRAETVVTEDSYACTRCRNTGQILEVQERQVNNQWVVCHSPYLIWKYRCHTNVESIASVKAVKYIYKYVYKGHDRTTMEFGRCGDEIKQYLDACYISSCEALWQLYMFDMQKQVPYVVHLQVHLPDLQPVVFHVEEDANGQDIITEHEGRATTLTGWFEANAASLEGDSRLLILYQDYPSKNVWNTKGAHKWTWTSRSQNSFAIGRMYHAYPTSGERFYLRLLLTTVPGATSFKYLRTFEGTLHPTFKDACIVCGLLEDDSEWHQCLSEARHMATGYQLRHLFVTILCDCIPTDPRRLWEEFADHICDDLARQLARLHIRENPTPEEVRDYGLYLIEWLLSPSGKTLKDFQGMP
jgi:Helitron helicase-like domain at N-terminus